MAIINLANLPNKTFGTGTNTDLNGTEQVFLNDSGIPKDVTIQTLVSKIKDETLTTANATLLAAETATDAAMLTLAIYMTKQIGHDSVANGAAYRVVGAGDVSVYLYQRIDSNILNDILLVEYPSLNMYQNMRDLYSVQNANTLIVTQTILVPYIGFN